MLRRLLIVLAFVPVATKVYAAPPAGWTCDASFFGDGSCDCGCGAVDSDCADATFASCEFNSCPTDGQVPKRADPTKCVANACGDGTIAGNETCDDGNATGGDGCSSACQEENGFTCNS